MLICLKVNEYDQVLLLCKNFIMKYQRFFLSPFLWLCLTIRLHSFDSFNAYRPSEQQFSEPVNIIFLCLSLFWCALLYTFAIVLTRKRDLAALLMFCYYNCLVALPNSAVSWTAVCDCGVS